MCMVQTEKSNTTFSAAVEETPVAFSDWGEKTQFDRSFTAKLILASEKTKSFYVQIANRLLKWDKVTLRTGWAGASFGVGRERLAYIGLAGNVLCLYLALDPEKDEAEKYRALNVSQVRKRSKTPAMFKIVNEGAKKHALEMIDLAAAQAGLKSGRELTPVVTEADFRIDTVSNLILRGLIRVQGTYRSIGGAYADTLESVSALLQRHGIYGQILGSFSEGEGSARLCQKRMLRAVDEIWVKAVEDCIPAMDELIRNPNHFIAETEDILPIERTKRVSGRSIAHLGQHADYLTVGQDGSYTPTKMLNVFREDSLLTYENKFLNTLLNRLYGFVHRRYQVAKTCGVDEKLETFEFENSFTHDQGRGCVKISVEYSRRDMDPEAKNVLVGTGLWNRVERLNDIVTGYVNSSFCKAMDKNFVRPPIMRTNAIIKNKYFRECLALWEFIESYDDAGYGILVEEKSQTLSQEYVKATYADAAMQYLLFRHNLQDGFSEACGQQFVRPELLIREKEGQSHREFFREESEQEPLGEDMNLILSVALAADERMKQNEGQIAVMIRSFRAKLCLADVGLKEKFARICNGFLKYQGVQLRYSHDFATMYYGTQVLARMTIGANTMMFYSSLIRREIPDDFNVSDVPARRDFADTPTCFKIESRKNLENAEEMADMFAIKYELELSEEEQQQLSPADFPAQSLLELMEKGWVRFSQRQLYRPADDVGVSYGPGKKAMAVLTAENVTRMAVVEPGKMAADIAVAPTEPLSTASREAQLLAQKISDLKRPDGNYDKPTEYGIDDSAAFMKDEEKNEPGMNDEHMA